MAGAVCVLLCHFPGNDHRHLFKVLELMIRNRCVDVLQKPDTGGAGHASDLPDFVLKGGLGLAVDPHLSNPKAEQRSDDENYGN
jgi:hypothetical protein